MSTLSGDSQVLATSNFTVSLPAEVKDIIYRYLLLAESAIQVHNGWKLVYKGAQKNRLALHTSILRVSKATFAQASRILYGENTFLYLLRDHPNSATDLRGRDEDDDDRSSAGDEGASDYDYDDSPRVARRRALQKRRAQKNDINFNKYSWLMRRIVVEAERNRYSEVTQDSMANAIRMFANKPPDGRGTRQRNIHTLTVRVAPQRIASHGPDAEDAYTFVNFFEPGSEVLRAIKSIECQYLHVDLLRGTGATATATRRSRGVDREPGCRLIVDMRYQRLERASLGSTSRDDMWAKDKLMAHRRKQKKDQSIAAVNQLALTVRQHCSQWTFDDGGFGESDLEVSDLEVSDLGE
ncbi:hypothetical protein ESCO_000473 [Escovopsis weberi]|uniref:Uncharacterized protein n=1 Tax=Escovopsis weberi TaxID=150374 RepID=A0A0N0RT74_ESCWE|nr:hypothetical protein ESCO_000473 [Escovopsis weberi]